VATISFSPASVSEVDPGDAIRVTIDHDGSLVLVAVLVVRAGISSEAAHVGPPLGSGTSTLFPHLATFVSATGVQYVFDITRNGDDGWMFDFQLRVWTAEGVGGPSNAVAAYTTSADALAVSVVDPGGTIAPEDGVDVETVGDVGDDLLVFAASGIDDIGDLADARRVELIYLGGTVVPPYAVSDEGGGVLRFTREGGWLASMVVLAGAPGSDVDLDIQAVTVFPETAEDPGASPVSSVVSPAPGTPITTDTALVVEVTDDSGSFRRVMLLVAYSSGDLAGITELAHDGDAFVGYYSAGCTREPIDDGFRFTIIRDGGWPASPTLRIFAFDRGGNEV
jgi:hypothetical protein